MTAPTIPVAASKQSPPARLFQPIAGRGATVGQPFGNVVLHREHRFRPINPPTVVRHYARRNDNLTEWEQYLARMDRDNLDPAGDLWLPAAVFGAVVLLGGGGFWLAGLFS